MKFYFKGKNEFVNVLYDISYILYLYSFQKHEFPLIHLNRLKFFASLEYFNIKRFLLSIDLSLQIRFDNNSLKTVLQK